MWKNLGASWAILLGIGCMMLANGLQGTLLGVRAGIEGFSTFTTGILMSGYFIGMFIGSLVSPMLVNRVGHIRVFSALASMASISILFHGVYIEPWVWMLMRIITGISFAGFYVVTESWLNDRASNETRGKVLSVYMLIVTGGMGAGMAANLIKAGYSLVVNDLNREQAKGLEGQGAAFADSPKAVAESSELVLSMLPNNDAVKAVDDITIECFSDADGAFVKQFPIFARSLVPSVALVVTISADALGLSSLTSRRNYAVLFFFALAMLTWLLSEFFARQVFDDPAWYAISPFQSSKRIAIEMLPMPQQFECGDRMLRQMPVGTAWMGLLCWTGAGLAVLAARIRKVEVVE